MTSCNQQKKTNQQNSEYTNKYFYKRKKEQRIEALNKLILYLTFYFFHSYEYDEDSVVTLAAVTLKSDLAFNMYLKFMLLWSSF